VPRSRGRGCPRHAALAGLSASLDGERAARVFCGHRGATSDATSYMWPLWMAAKTWTMSMDPHKKKVHEPSCEVRINLKTYGAIHYKLKYVKLEKH
jgi:hypothetical protein